MNFMMALAILLFSLYIVPTVSFAEESAKEGCLMRSDIETNNVRLANAIIDLSEERLPDEKRLTAEERESSIQASHKPILEALGKRYYIIESPEECPKGFLLYR